MRYSKEGILQAKLLEDKEGYDAMLPRGGSMTNEPSQTRYNSNKWKMIRLNKNKPNVNQMLMLDIYIE